MRVNRAITYDADEMKNFFIKDIQHRLVDKKNQLSDLKEMVR